MGGLLALTVMIAVAGVLGLRAASREKRERTQASADIAAKTRP
jgi:hypothetical protein